MERDEEGQVRYPRFGGQGLGGLHLHVKLPKPHVSKMSHVKAGLSRVKRTIAFTC